MMHVIDWYIVGSYTLGAVLVVTQVGKPKKPTTPTVAAVLVAINLTIVVAMLWAHGVIR